MTDVEYMRLALEMASSTVGQTSPNPIVGAVVVKDGKIVGMGAHLKAGEEHAEVHALNMAGDEAEGSTIYVTLEPCSHYGKTPPCANLIINKKVKRAVIATLDPNPQVAGNGIEKLKNAGVEVTTGVEKEEADWLNRHFFHFIRTKLPYVTLKTASSLDGKTATYTGESQWITGKDARADGHRLRRSHHAILVGIGTVLKDDPSLTARVSKGNSIHPVRVVLDHQLRIPLSAKMITDQEAPVWVICSKQASEEKKQQLTENGVQVMQINGDNMEIAKVLQILGENNITSVYVEGGASIHGSFLKERNFQEIVCYIAPKLIGGTDAPSVIGGKGIANMSEVIDLKVVGSEQIGNDLKITAVPDWKE